MATDADVTADAFARALGALFNLRQAGIDWASIAQAILAFREERRQRWLDAHDELSAAPRHSACDPEPVRREANAGGDAAALYIEVNAALLASVLRMGRDWQRILKDSVPALKHAADEYQAEPDPAPKVTEALINEVVDFTHVVGKFLHDQGAQLERELLAVQSEILGRHADDSPARRLSKRKA